MFKLCGLENEVRVYRGTMIDRRSTLRLLRLATISEVGERFRRGHRRLLGSVVMNVTLRGGRTCVVSVVSVHRRQLSRVLGDTLLLLDLCTISHVTLGYTLSPDV